MAHFAKLNENNEVLEVHCVANAALNKKDEEKSGIAFLTDWSNGHTNWKQTSYNGTIRKQYAAVGYFYDAVADVFIAPQPFASWSIDENFDWQAPTPKPEGFYIWDETNLEWVKIETLAE